MEIRPIGRLRTCFGSKFAVPRQPGLCPSAWGVLELDDEFRGVECVRGLEGFSHVWLIFGFHETVSQGWRPTVRPPRLGGNDRVGVFASRSTFRPNGLGLSLVKLDEIAFVGKSGMNPPLLHFSGVDLIDGTPIFDMKPYLPYAEAPVGALSGYAGEELMRFEVRVDGEVAERFGQLPERDRKIIFEVLSLDVRPAAGREEPEKVYGALVCGRNVRFRYEGECCVLLDITVEQSAKY